MPRIALYVLVAVLVVACGAYFYLPKLMDDTDFRIDDFSFGSSSNGVGATEPTVRVGKKVWLLMKLRGCTPESGKCKGTLEIKLQSQSGKVLTEMGKRPFEFPKRTRITHLDVNETLIVPPAEPGGYVVKVEAVDEVAGKTASKEFKFQIAP